ncbi:hypothetical protein QQG74_09295 [Micromonospora sp. FIMYZ51]|uniref:hypothetical protein n=1 Tax=Micromonospora sp. FIMYZ51 TaxID=3051832 RepID=UPI00311EB6AF
MCTACRVMPAQPGEAWCPDCAETLDPAEFVAGVHTSQIDPSERPWTPLPASNTR